jgi:hypothetical protein
MALQNSLFALAFSALLLAPVAARADVHEASAVTIARAPSSASHYHPGPSPATSRRDGRYELRTVRHEVPGRYERVWVGERCEPARRRYVQRCEPGHYEQRWVPGFTESREEWVWVSYPQRPYGRG